MIVAGYSQGLHGGAAAGEEDMDEGDEEEFEEEENGILEEEEDYNGGQESELEQYLRDVSSGLGAGRAKTAPLKAGKQAEQFKLTPGFTQLEQAAVCAV